MRTLSTQTLACSIALLALWCAPGIARTDSADVPGYLALARELVRNTKPDDNRYSLGGQFISFPGDPPANRYAVRADCSGFLLAGALVGWARTFRETRRFFSYDPRFPSATKLRKAAVGRPVASLESRTPGCERIG